MRVEDADGVAGELGQFHRPGLDFVYRTAWTVRGKHRPMSTLNGLGQRQQAAPSGARARSSRGEKAYPLNRARDQFTVKTAADQNHQFELAVEIAGRRN